MPNVRDPPDIHYVKSPGDPAAVLTDGDGNLVGTPAFPLTVNAVLVSSSFDSVGLTGVAVPLHGNQVAGPNPGGLLTAPMVRTSDPVAGNAGMVVRQLGTLSAIVAGSGAAGAPAAGVVTVQGIAGGTAQPITDNTTATLNNGAEVAVGAAAAVVLAANAARKSALIQNTGAANIRVGTVGVTNVTGFRMVPGAIFTMAPPFDPVNAIYAIREGGIDSIAFGMEVT